jgi:hypothetical protein
MLSGASPPSTGMFSGFRESAKGRSQSCDSSSTGCVRRTSEALDRQDEAREKAAAPEREAAADEQERADRVADGVRQPPETPSRQMPVRPKPSTS